MRQQCIMVIHCGMIWKISRILTSYILTSNYCGLQCLSRDWLLVRGDSLMYPRDRGLVTSKQIAPGAGIICDDGQIS